MNIWRSRSGQGKDCVTVFVIFNCAMESLSGNFISLLNEYQQRTQCRVEYEEGSTEGPSHNKTYANIIHSVNMHVDELSDVC